MAQPYTGMQLCGGKISQKKTHLEAKLTHIAITLVYQMTSGLCTAENTIYSKQLLLLLQLSIVVRCVLIVKGLARLLSKNKHKHLPKKGVVQLSSPMNGYTHLLRYSRIATC